MLTVAVLQRCTVPYGDALAEPRYFRWASNPHGRPPSACTEADEDSNGRDHGQAPTQFLNCLPIL